MDFYLSSPIRLRGVHRYILAFLPLTEQGRREWVWVPVKQNFWAPPAKENRLKIKRHSVPGFFSGPLGPGNLHPLSATEGRTVTVRYESKKTHLGV